MVLFILLISHFLHLYSLIALIWMLNRNLYSYEKAQFLRFVGHFAPQRFSNKCFVHFRQHQGADPAVQPGGEGGPVRVQPGPGRLQQRRRERAQLPSRRHYRCGTEGGRLHKARLALRNQGERFGG